MNDDITRHQPGKLSALLKLIIARMQRRKQKVKIRIPKERLPAFEAFGFSLKFVRNVDRHGIYNVTLPDGWQLKTEEDGTWPIIIDEKGRERGTYFPPKDGTCDYGFMILLTRYSINCKYPSRRNSLSGEKIVKVIVKDNAEGKIIYVAWRAPENSREYEDLVKNARDWLDNNKPGWEKLSECWN